MRVSPQALFGEGFYQDEQEIRIDKTSLGLLARDYSAQALFVALIVQALEPFNGVITGNGFTLTGNGHLITYRNHNAYQHLNLFFWQRSFVISKAGIPLVRFAYVFELYAAINDQSTEISIGEVES